MRDGENHFGVALEGVMGNVMVHRVKQGRGTIQGHYLHWFWHEGSIVSA